MRLLLAALALIACSPAEPPQAPLVGAVAIGEMRYGCSADGLESMQYITRDGEKLRQEYTGRRCDFDTFEALRREGVIVLERANPIEPHSDWLARERPEA